MSPQAQNLIQAWVESGIWTDTQPRLQCSSTAGIAPSAHYEGSLLTGNVAYSTTKFGDAPSTTPYALYVERRDAPISSVQALRDALKASIRLNDKEWDDEFLVKIKIDAGRQGS